MLYYICQIYRQPHLNLSSSSALRTATLKSNQLPEMPQQTHTFVLTDLCLDYSWITNNMIKAVIKVGVICLSAALTGVTINC